LSDAKFSYSATVVILRGFANSCKLDEKLSFSWIPGLIFAVVSGFADLCFEDQIALTQEAVYPVTLIFHAQKYNLKTGEHSWFINTKDEKDFVLQFFPHFAALGKHFEITGLTIKLLDLDPIEYGLFALITVFAPSGWHFFRLNELNYTPHCLLERLQTLWS
jgi:hypothetical protein